MKKEIAKALTDGLLAGYAGKGKIESVTRAGFAGKSSNAELTSDTVYHDEWYVTGHLGAGQELVRVGDQTYSRVYGGGTPDPKILTELGTSIEAVGEYLKKKIVELGEQTRLDQDCNPARNGDWRYAYKILETDPQIPVITASESIYFKEVRVHLHPFILTPVV